jgi:REP element-mobilizing transposase RayT
MPTYFLRLHTFFQVPFFENGDLGQLMREAIQSVVNAEDIHLDEYTIMPAEVIMLLGADDRAAIERIVATIKLESSAVVKEALRRMRGLITFEEVGAGFSRARNTSIWADKDFIQALKGDEDIQIKREYICSKRIA